MADLLDFFVLTDVSLMPESLSKDFSPQQLRDLFSILETEPQPGRKD
jgi:hypothetical protein